MRVGHVLRKRYFKDKSRKTFTLKYSRMCKVMLIVLILQTTGISSGIFISRDQKTYNPSCIYWRFRNLKLVIYIKEINCFININVFYSTYLTYSLAPSLDNMHFILFKHGSLLAFSPDENSLYITGPNQNNNCKSEILQK